MSMAKKRVSFSELPDDRTHSGTGCRRGYKEEEAEEREEEEEDLEREKEEDGGEEGWGEEEDARGGRLASFTDPALLQKPAFPPRVAHCSDGSPATVTAAALSPVRKKLSALQERRVNTVLLEALQLVDCSKDELITIEKSIKKLRDAIYGFSILVDKQVNIIGAETLEERGRIRADIQDLAENLKISYEGFASTCSRMRHTLATGKQHIQLHKKRNSAVTSTAASTRAGAKSPDRGRGSSSPMRAKVVSSSGYGVSSSSPTRRAPMAAAASSPSIADGGLSLSPTCGRVPLVSILDCQASELEMDTTAETEQQHHHNRHQYYHDTTPLYMTPEFLGSLMRSVGLDEKEFLDPKDLIRFLQEMLTFSIAKSQALTFMGKAFHRRLIPSYARDLVQLIAEELQLSTTTTVVLVPNNTFCDFMCQAPYHFDALLDRLYVSDANQYTGEPSPVASPMAPPAANPFSDHFTSNGRVLHDGKIVQTLLVNKPDAEMMETAEQTLAMAKLLHDLANAESEARRGNRISIRAQPTRNNEFSRAYLATSKELLSRETGVN